MTIHELKGRRVGACVSGGLDSRTIARKFRDLDIAVTSVLQTTAGKMIFGRFADSDEEYRRRPAPAHSSEDRGNARS